MATETPSSVAEKKAPATAPASPASSSPNASLSGKDIPQAIGGLGEISRLQGLPTAVVIGAIVVLLMVAAPIALRREAPVVALLIAAVIGLIGVGLFLHYRDLSGLLRQKKPLEGHWWEFIRPAPGPKSLPETAPAVSFFRVAINRVTGALDLHGRVFDAAGRKIANWSSTANYYDASARRLYYFWEGQTDATGSRQNGYGQFDFDFADGGLLHAAVGRYGDLSRIEQRQLITKLTGLRRATAEDAQTIWGDVDSEIVTLVLSKLSRQLPEVSVTTDLPPRRP